jgi:hypothetical protein
MRIGRISAVAVLAIGTMLGSAVSASAAPTPNPTKSVFSYASDPAQPGTSWEYIGQGSATYIAGTDGQTTTTISRYGNNQAFDVQIRQSAGGWNTHWWDVAVDAPAGERLHVGTYNAHRAEVGISNSDAGLAVTGDGRGCNEVHGSITINAIDNDRSGLRMNDMTFVQYCDNNPNALRGSLQFNVPA